MSVSPFDERSKIEIIPITISFSPARIILIKDIMKGRILAQAIRDTFEPLSIEENIDKILDYIRSEINLIEKFRIPMTGRNYTKKPPVFLYGRLQNKEYFFLCRTSGSYGEHPGLYEIKTMKYDPCLYAFVRDKSVILTGTKKSL